MIGRSTVKITNLTRSSSAETILSNSQSPSFVIFRRTSDNRTDGEETQELTGLRIRDVKKRQMPISPISSKKLAPPAAKKIKGATVIDSKTEIGGYCSQTRESERRTRAVTGIDVDMIEMYKTLCKSATLIPVPQTLIPDDDEPLTGSIARRDTCRIEDRKRVLLNVFARRFNMKVSCETLHLGAALLDKCLDMMVVKIETLDELAAVTVAIASKIEDVTCLTLGNLLDYELIENTPISMVASLERFVLASLSFQVTIPTPLHFASYMLIHLAASESKRNFTHYFLELSLLYVHNRDFPSDVVAYAATCLAFVMETEPGRTVKKVFRETEHNLRLFASKSLLVKRKQNREAMRTLADLFVVAPTENHSIFREYSTPRRNSVAVRQINTDLQELLRIDSS